MKTLLLACSVLLLLAAPAWADEFPVIVGQFFGGGVGCCFLPVEPLLITTNGDDTIAFGPGDTGPVNLGLPARPWRNGYFQNKVSAHSFVANGAPGLNTVIHLGGCVLTIQGGLIVSAVTTPFNQPCP